MKNIGHGADGDGCPAQDGENGTFYEKHPWAERPRQNAIESFLRN
jgi:hypothetical protein